MAPSGSSDSIKSHWSISELAAKWEKFTELEIIDQVRAGRLCLSIYLPPTKVHVVLSVDEADEQVLGECTVWGYFRLTKMQGASWIENKPIELEVLHPQADFFSFEGWDQTSADNAWEDSSAGDVVDLLIKRIGYLEPIERLVKIYRLNDLLIFSGDVERFETKYVNDESNLVAPGTVPKDDKTAKKSMSLQDRRESELQIWLDSRQYHLGPLGIPYIDDHTQQSLWTTLSGCNEFLFRPLAPRTIQDFFAHQNLCEFKRGPKFSD